MQCNDVIVHTMYDRNSRLRSHLPKGDRPTGASCRTAMDHRAGPMRPDEGADSPHPEPLFLLERMAHIRCFCLTVHVNSGTTAATLTAANAVVQGSVVNLDCRFQEPGDESNSPTATASETSCCLQLDVGEELDCNAPVTCTIDNGYAYTRLSLAPERTLDVSSETAAAATAYAQTRTVIFWGKSGGNVWGSPVPCPPKMSTSALLAGRSSAKLREEAGMLHRAAEQRRRERTALTGARLCCACCASRQRSSSPLLLTHVAGAARFLPDRSAAQDELLADLIEMGRSHAFLPNAAPPCDESSAKRSATGACFLGRHSIHLDAQPPPASDAICSLNEAFAAGGSHAHSRAAASREWAPLRCVHCGSLLGATCVEAKEGSTAVAVPPLWFDESAAPELGCTLQLLKAAVRCMPPPAHEDASRDASADGEVERDAALSDTLSALSGYSMAALVAERILKVAEDEFGESTRRFALVGADSTSADGESLEATIMLLSPYVSLSTNGQQRAADSGCATDAIKVMYSTDSSTMAALGAHANNGCGPPPVHQLVLPEAAERRAVLDVLQSSSEMLPPSARRVGALRVGYLPVAPTWD